MAEKSETGRRRVAAAIRAGTSRLNSGRNAIPDPAIGKPRDGIEPGRWRTPGFFGLPDDSPVQVLGMDGDLLYAIDSMGQLAAVPSTGFGINKAQQLFAGRAGFLWWAWPRVGQKGAITGLDLNSLRDDLYAAAYEKGLWRSVEKLRGLGAWRGPDFPDGSPGKLILHCGDRLWIEGKLRSTGEIDGFFYPRRPRMFEPYAEPVEDDLNPAPEIFRLLQRWNWRQKDYAPLIMLGFLGAALLGGALPWRPSIFLVGDKAVGKTTLQKLVKLILGPMLVASPDTTQAGISQRVGTDALPIAVDELEADADPVKVRKVLDLARLASDGAVLLRGGADHKGVEFQARSPFLFSAINMPWMSAATRTRLAVLDIDALRGGEETPVLHDPETVAPRLLRRLADAWPGFFGLFQDYRAALRGGGHDDRGQNTFGIFLALAHQLMGDQAMEEAGFPIETLDRWAEILPAGGLSDRELAISNWRACLEHLFGYRLDAWKSGVRRSVGAWIEGAIKGGELATTAKQELEHADLLLLPRGDKKNRLAPEKTVLCIPNESGQLGQAYRETRWGGPGGQGTWMQALRQGPPDVISFDRGMNKHRIGMRQARCTLVVLEEFMRLQEEEG